MLKIWPNRFSHLRFILKHILIFLARSALMTTTHPHLIRRLLLLIAGTLLLTACASQPQDGAPRKPPKNLHKVPDAVPQEEARSRYGNPPAYQINGKWYHVMDSSEGYRATGIASWYGTKFHGRRASIGEPYDMYAMTAAHTTLPLPTYVRVTNLDNKRSVVVRVTDRGPFHDNRIIDLSYTAAHRLDMLHKGTARVEVVALTTGGNTHQPAPPAFVDTPHPTAPPPSGQLYLQVAAFSTQESALQLAGHLDLIDASPVEIRQADRGGQLLYQVRIGPLPDTDNANQMIALLDQENFNSPMLITE